MAETRSPNESTDGTPKHILVVNDTQEILDLFKELLEEEGYQVSLYSFAFQDVEPIREIKPDLVILDFLVGGEDTGWQLLQKMKMQRDTVNIPVVVCSAALNLLREMEGHLRAKDVIVVPKPFDIDDLLHAVDKALDTHRYGDEIPGGGDGGEVTGASSGSEEASPSPT